MQIFPVDVRGDGEFFDLVDLALKSLLAKVAQQFCEGWRSNELFRFQYGSQRRLPFFEGQVDYRGHGSPAVTSALRLYHAGRRAGGLFPPGEVRDTLEFQ